MEPTQNHSMACSKCDKPMAWHSMQTIGPQEVNVFECKACKKLSAVAVNGRGLAAMPA